MKRSKTSSGTYTKITSTGGTDANYVYPKDTMTVVLYAAQFPPGVYVYAAPICEPSEDTTYKTSSEFFVKQEPPLTEKFIREKIDEILNKLDKIEKKLEKKNKKRVTKKKVGEKK